MSAGPQAVSGVGPCAWACASQTGLLGEAPGQSRRILLPSVCSTNQFWPFPQLERLVAQCVLETPRAVPGALPSSSVQNRVRTAAVGGTLSDGPHHGVGSPAGPGPVAACEHMAEAGVGVCGPGPFISSRHPQVGGIAWQPARGRGRWGQVPSRHPADWLSTPGAAPVPVQGECGAKAGCSAPLQPCAA